ncbi:RhuM family protein [Maribacter polysaccharolyticus]|uniref:RhuM family protein n=1 Tax=Maribacter polysaccharolyticus TaxID=3020831 RepID=UPI00237F3142|nr:RhuM family protein [Maribacter polysaccharolyticus]MDE3744126.1 RhuM family protein [Maribacter polysaccharolyticus]
MNRGEIILYDDKPSIEIRLDNDTIWLNQRQMAELFDKDTDTIGLHLKNIFATKELDKRATTEKYSVVQKEGNRHVKRKVLFYNLDAIISVGYRVNSKQGTQFRIWATRTLKEYLVRGYVVNENRLAQKEEEIQILRNGISILGRAMEEKSNHESNEWLRLFSQGLELLDDYDHESLDKRGLTKKEAIFPSIEEYQVLIQQMSTEFDSDVFGREKDKNFQSSLAQITKGFGTEDFYPTIEEKAATLLYLITKNHSFVDGNKRIAAACFLKFLSANSMLVSQNGKAIISNDTLASLTLFIASSKPEEMETVKRLVISVLNRGN